MTSFTLAHISDTHIGYEAYKARASSGENARSVDVARAFKNAVDDIVAADPPLVIHSGDVADRTIIPIRMMLFIRDMFASLASLRPDGTRRQVVVVAGNHEIPRNKREACFLELLKGMPGVQVVTKDYSVVDFTDPELSAHDSLQDVLIHALPHDALKTVDFDNVTPVKGKINIISSHGVAGGTELFRRSVGREFAIPTDVLLRNWEYGALGHWHKQGPINLVSTGSNKNEDKGRIWYAGSTENMGFGDLKDDGIKRGYLLVKVNPKNEPDVTRRHLPIRSMFRLPVLDGENMTPSELLDALIVNLRKVEIQGAVVSQIVENVPRETWSLVETSRLYQHAASALHYDVSLKPIKVESSSSNSSDTFGLGDIDNVLTQQAQVVLSEHEREEGLSVARSLIQVEMARAFKADAGKSAALAEEETVSNDTNFEETSQKNPVKDKELVLTSAKTKTGDQND